MGIAGKGPKSDLLEDPPIILIEFFNGVFRHKPKISRTFRGRLTGRTAGSEPANGGSNLSPEANFHRAFRRWLNGLVLETSVRRFKSCRSDQFFRTRGQIGKGAGLRNRILKVRILPRAPTLSGDECKTSSKQPFKLLIAGSSPVVPSNSVSRMSNKGQRP